MIFLECSSINDILVLYHYKNPWLIIIADLISIGRGVWKKVNKTLRCILEKYSSGTVHLAKSSWFEVLHPGYKISHSSIFVKKIRENQTNKVSTVFSISLIPYYG